MKLFLSIIFSSLFIGGITYAASSAYYDLSNGQPAVMEDATDAIASTYDFSNGQPTVMEEFYQGAVSITGTPNGKILIWEE